jgi:hypothetical protein
MLNFAERTGCGAVIMVWSFLLTSPNVIYRYAVCKPAYLSIFFLSIHLYIQYSTFTKTSVHATSRTPAFFLAEDCTVQYTLLSTTIVLYCTILDSNQHSTRTQLTNFNYCTVLYNTLNYSTYSIHKTVQEATRVSRPSKVFTLRILLVSNVLFVQ